jgi:CubicO group peptidase (beta-lactamase class C family)
MRIFKMLNYCTLFSILLLSCHTRSSEQKLQAAVVIDTGYHAPKPAVITDEEKNRLHNDVEVFSNKYLRAPSFNGALLVAKKGNIVFEKYTGYFNIKKKDSIINEHTAFHLASLSKTFTAMAVLKLYEQGKLNLSDDVRKFFPTFPYGGVTVFMLLTHRSALPNYVYFMEDLGWDKHKPLTNQDVIDYIVQYQPPLWGKPGTHFRYCNTNYALLASIVEKASGKHFPEFMDSTFFKPLQMTDTYVFTWADSARAMPSYNFKGVQERLNYLDGGYGDKNIYSTPRDLLKWDQALYSGQFFRQSTLDSAFTPYSNERKGIKNYGLGWRMNIYPNGKKIIFHTGWWHGNNTILIRLLADTATIIAVGNKYNRNIYMSKNLVNIFEPYFKTAEEETNEGDVNEHRKYKKKTVRHGKKTVVKQKMRKHK